MAARCTACSTVFRVVADQLRVSEGWVRCGRCAEVFNAAENLIDLETGAPHRLGPDGLQGLQGLRAPVPQLADAPLAAPSPPPPLPPPPPPFPPAPARPATPRPAPQPPAPQTPQVPQVPPVQPTAAAPRVAPPAPRAEASRPLPPTAAPAPDLAYEQTLPFRREDADAARAVPGLPPPGDVPPMARSARVGDLDERAALRASRVPPPDSVAAGFEPTALLPRGEGAPAAAWATDPPLYPDEAAPQPSFVRQADRAARWRQPRVRAGMAAASAALVLLLGLQLLLSQRDLAAARWPLARAVLEPACAVFGCTVQAPRLIDNLAVDSSGLLRVERSDLYRLSVALRNRGPVEVQLPALDLTLTDPQGRLLARRVLRAAELGAAAGTLAPGKELTLQATLQASAQGSTPGGSAAGAGGVAGYTIELFYP